MTAGREIRWIGPGCRAGEPSLKQSPHYPANPGPICFVNITPPFRTSIEDAVDSRSLADCSQGVLVKAMGSKDVKRVQGASTAR